MRKFFGAFALTLCAALTASFVSCKVEEAETEYVTNEVETIVQGSALFAMRNKISILLRGYGKRAVPAVYFAKEIKNGKIRQK